MTEQVTKHDVRYDYGGRRVTCFTPACQTATLIRRDYMSSKEFGELLDVFLEAHPPKNGELTDADHEKPPRTVESIKGQ